MMKKILSVVIAAAMALSLAACGGGSASSTTSEPAAESTEQAADTTAASGDTIMIQLGHCNPVNDEDHFTYFGKQMNEYLQELSGGKYGIEVIGDSQLGGERDLFEGLQMGTVDAAIVTNLIFTSSIPQTCMLELPFLFDNEAQAYETFTNPEVQAVIEDVLYNEWGIHAPTYVEVGMRKTVVAEDKVKTYDDFKGLKIRVPESPIYVDVFQAINANPTTMAYSECYTAVQQGTIDGLEIPVAGIYPAKWHELCKEVVNTNHIYVAGRVCFSRSFWETLTEEEQGWFDEAAKKAALDEVEFVRGTEASRIEEIKASGCNVVDLSDEDVQKFRDAMQPVYEKYIPEVGEDFYNLVMGLLGR